MTHTPTELLAYLHCYCTTPRAVQACARAGAAQGRRMS